MSSTSIQPSSLDTPWALPYKGHVGMLCLILAESSIFAIFVVAYIFYMGKSLSGPTPREVLQIPVFATMCLLSSSFTIHTAVAALRKANLAAFRFLWFATFALGAIFLGETGHEWYRLIYERDFTISTNLFGTTYYSLVGLHAFHVTVGLAGLLIVLLLALPGKVRPEHSAQVDTFAMYWHFVDVVWVVVFTVVYIVGR
ncbi:MAG TPA: cytochrome c oxidase subunit 3 [Candidatus Acidoferrum sp.]|nr:cytochrome c oxidase subunit 3 [Candidatus Acidoferrum sp.]